MDPSIEVVLLDAAKDGVLQITDTLAQRSNISASTFLRTELRAHSRSGRRCSTLTRWRVPTGRASRRSGRRFPQMPTCLIYGCSFGSGVDGAKAAQMFADITGADIAASDDLTGHADLGGDWDLEVEVGHIESHTGISERAQSEWHGLLTLTASGSETRVNTTTSGSEQTSNTAGRQIASDSAGNYVVVWDNGSEIYARKYNSSGTAITGELHVNTNTANTQASPAVAMDSTGKFVVTWQSNHSGGDYGVRGQLFDANGNMVGSEFALNTYTTNDQVNTAVAMTTSGFIATWMSNGQDGSNKGVYAQRFDSTGAKVGSEFRVNTTTSNDQWDSQVAVDASGNFVITWTSNSQDGSYDGVYAQRL